MIVFIFVCHGSSMHCPQGDQIRGTPALKMRILPTSSCNHTSVQHAALVSSQDVCVCVHGKSNVVTAAITASAWLHAGASTTALPVPVFLPASTSHEHHNHHPTGQGRRGKRPRTNARPKARHQRGVAAGTQARSYSVPGTQCEGASLQFQVDLMETHVRGSKGSKN